MKVKVIMPENHTLETLDGTFPRIEGQIKIKYRPHDTNIWKTTPWEKIDADTDYTCPFSLKNLMENTRYDILVLSKTFNKGITSIEGSFTTAQPKDLSTPIHFMVTTCHEYNHQDIPENGGFWIFDEMKKLKPNFLVHSKDILYHDKMSKMLNLARWNWQK